MHILLCSNDGLKVLKEELHGIPGNDRSPQSSCSFTVESLCCGDQHNRSKKLSEHNKFVQTRSNELGMYDPSNSKIQVTCEEENTQSCIYP